MKTYAMDIRVKITTDAPSLLGGAKASLETAVRQVVNGINGTFQGVHHASLTSGSWFVEDVHEPPAG